jgi:hypothetical protein
MHSAVSARQQPRASAPLSPPPALANHGRRNNVPKPSATNKSASASEAVVSAD